MGYYIEVKGSFQIDPPLDPAVPLPSNFYLTEWRVSPDGRLLFLPSGTSVKSSSLDQACMLLKGVGHSVNGRAEWCGEDEAHGTITVENGKVHFQGGEPDTLSKTEVARLLEQLRSGDESQKCEVIEILDYFGENSAGIIKALIPFLSDPSLRVQMSAATFFGNRGEDAAPAVDALIKMLSDEEAWVRAAAAEALGKIGKAAEPAVPHLERLLRDPNYGPSGRAKEALMRIQGNENIG